MIEFTGTQEITKETDGMDNMDELDDMTSLDYIVVPRSEYRSLVSKASKYDTIVNDISTRIHFKKYECVNSEFLMSITGMYEYKEWIDAKWKEELMKEKEQSK